MLPLTLLALLPLASCSPLPAPEPAPEALADYLAHPASNAQPRARDMERRAVRLAHTDGHIRRAQHAARSRLPTYRRGESASSSDALDASWLLAAAARNDERYNGGKGGLTRRWAAEAEKRTTGEVSLIDYNLDASYSGSVSIGTPAQSFDIILDTGSSDLWVAGTGCASGCSSMTQFDASSSSSYVNKSTAFSISYGSGSAKGTLAQDTVTLGGYSVASQTFATCTSVSSGLISSAVSGIMGLSWQSLAYSGATPWWTTLAKSSAWSENLFGFYLKRYRNQSGATSVEEDGGTATFGYLDPSLYSGDITYVTVPDNAEYWRIAMDSMTMQDKSISLGSTTSVAVDTGTTLIGGPSSVIASIYAAIPDSRQMSGSYANYYEYPCSTTIDFTVTFGGFTITISDEDFNLGQYSSNASMCTGAAFVQSMSSGSTVQWILGATALKNVYSVYRYDPPAVGFAKLASSSSSSSSSSSAASSSTSVSSSSSSSAATSVATSSTVTSAALSVAADTSSSTAADTVVTADTTAKASSAVTATSAAISGSGLTSSTSSAIKASTLALGPMVMAGTALLAVVASCIF